MLLARGVEVPAEDPRVSRGAVGEMAVDGLVRADLRQVGLGADRRVHVDDLGTVAEMHGQHALGPRHAVDQDWMEGGA